jgi:hypothetical protein
MKFLDECTIPSEREVSQDLLARQGMTGRGSGQKNHVALHR